MNTRPCPACGAAVAAPVGGPPPACPRCRQTLPPLAKRLAPPAAPPAFEVVDDGPAEFVAELADEPPTARPVRPGRPVAVPTFEVTPYRAVSGTGPVGAVATLAVGLIAAGVCGVVASAIGQVFYLIFVFPLAIGFGVGFAAAVTAKASKMHSLPVAAAIGVASGMTAMLVVHFSDFLWASARGLPRGVGFLQFMDLQAQVGVTIGRRGGGWNLGYAGSVIYWLVEVAVVAVLVMMMAIGYAARPFCAACNEWKRKETYGPLDGHPGDAKEWVEAGEVGRLAAPGGSGGAELRVELSVCPRCRGADSSADVCLSHVTRSKEGESVNVLCHTSYPAAAIPVVRALDDAD